MASRARCRCWRAGAVSGSVAASAAAAAVGGAAAGAVAGVGVGPGCPGCGRAFVLQAAGTSGLAGSTGSQYCVHCFRTTRARIAPSCLLPVPASFGVCWYCRCSRSPAVRKNTVCSQVDSARNFAVLWHSILEAGSKNNFKKTKRNEGGQVRVSLGSAIKHTGRARFVVVRVARMCYVGVRVGVFVGPVGSDRAVACI